MLLCMLALGNLSIQQYSLFFQDQVGISHLRDQRSDFSQESCDAFQFFPRDHGNMLKRLHIFLLVISELTCLCSEQLNIRRLQ